MAARKVGNIIELLVVNHFESSLSNKTKRSVKAPYTVFYKYYHDSPKNREITSNCKSHNYFYKHSDHRTGKEFEAVENVRHCYRTLLH